MQPRRRLRGTKVPPGQGSVAAGGGRRFNRGEATMRQGGIVGRVFRGAAGALLFTACLGASPAPRAAAADPIAETRARDLFVRRVGSEPRDAVEFLRKEAKAKGVKDAIVAFDAISFAPPPGRNEFNSEHRFADDLPEWLDALRTWKTEDGIDLRAGSTLMGRPERVGEPGWGERISEEANRTWWDEGGFGGFEPAGQWVTRFLAQRGWLTDMPGPFDAVPDGAFLVLVCGNLTPERWVRWTSEDDEEDSHWRRLLLPVGDYWDEEHVATQCRRAHVMLHVVSPEARFGDFLPLSEAPDLPWVSRPIWPQRSEDPPPWPRRGLPPVTPPGDGRMPPPDGPLRRARPPRTRRSGSGLDLGEGGEYGRRFKSVTPFWYGAFTSGDVRLFQTDVPSGYGTWPQSRTASATGGRYVFYPLKPSNFLDVLPYDGSLLADLQPSYVQRGSWTEEHHGDPVMRALSEAEDLVFGRTPWADSEGKQKAAKGWSGFASVAPPASTEDYRVRRKPYDLALDGDEGTIEAEGQRLAEVLPAYDAAIDLLDRTLGSLRAGEWPGLPRRDHANLLSARFDFAMSAFHLHALSLYMQEIERFRPEGEEGRSYAYVVTYVPTIRMSDVLDGYEGRTLPAAAEDEFAIDRKLAPFRWQGNLLGIPESSPFYRAVRAPDRVLARLDERLVDDALRMISTGRDVMEAFGKTPWGATVYYSEAYTFVFKPVTNLLGNVGHAPGGKDKKKKPAPVTPTDGSPSGSGGPTTPGK